MVPPVGVGKRKEDKPPTVSIFLEEFGTRRSRLIGISAKARAPRQIAHLQRVMHKVGTQDRFLSPANERQTGCVAGRQSKAVATTFGRHTLVARPGVPVPTS
jgi:hypothetical protein